MEQKEKELVSEEENKVEVSEETKAPEQEKESDSGHHHHHHHHHHRHHGHHHRHHKHRSKKSRRKTSFKKFWSKNKKVLLPLVLVLIVGVIVGGIVLAVELITNSGQLGTLQTDTGTEGSVVLSVSVFDTPQTVTNDAAMAIKDNQDMTKEAHVLLRQYNDGDNRLDVCRPVQIAFYVANKPGNYEVEKFVVEVSESDSFADSVIYTLDAQQKSVDLFNLKTDTTYYYKVNVHFTNSVVSWAGGSFQTKAGPRILTVGGIRNIRDIGGWMTQDGKTVKQGLLYRGTELDGKNKSDYKLTDEGKKVLLDMLQIKTDLDLRWASEIPANVDVFGEGVNHYTCGMPHYTDVFQPSGEEPVRQVFGYLADPDNYPVYMHCIYGRDRTGTICALLMAVLGVSKEDISREYQLTALSNQNLDIAFSSFMTQLNQYEGDTLAQKAETYLLSVGVTAEEIASVRTIFLG